MANLAYFGTGDFAVPPLEALHRSGHQITAVISQPDRPAGRGRRIQPTAVHKAADQLGLPHLQTADVNSENFTTLLGAAEIGVVAAFGQKISGALLDALPRGCVNIHGSLLPKYRGAAPFQWAILNGESETGVTVFQLDQKWDNGPVWGLRSLKIGETETADELHDRLAILGAELIDELVPNIVTGNAQPVDQDHSLASRAPKLKKSDGYLDWSRPAVELVRWIHGLWSWPVASADFVSRTGKIERIGIARARVVDDAALPNNDLPAGAFHSNHTLQCGQGRLELLEVKPSGKGLMAFADFANGRQIAPPDRLVQVEAV
jgi:methionyl-tRNA formyltransferase